MAMIRVQNIRYDTTEDELRRLFAGEGDVVAITFPVDDITGVREGIALVEMSDAAGAREAVRRLHRRIFGGRRLHVTMADHEPGLAEEAPAVPIGQPPDEPPRPSPRPHRPERSTGRWQSRAG